MREICAGCGQTIDPEWCWCGDPADRHKDHSLVPMGCLCHFGSPIADFRVEDFEFGLEPES